VRDRWHPGHPRVVPAREAAVQGPRAPVWTCVLGPSLVAACPLSSLQVADAAAKSRLHDSTALYTRRVCSHSPPAPHQPLPTHPKTTALQSQVRAAPSRRATSSWRAGGAPTTSATSMGASSSGGSRGSPSSLRLRSRGSEDLGCGI